MCLGIPGRVVELVEGSDQVASVDVAGTRRQINIGMLDARVEPGDWVLTHMGFAMEIMDDDEAAEALEGFQFLAGGDGFRLG